MAWLAAQMEIVALLCKSKELKFLCIAYHIHTWLSFCRLDNEYNGSRNDESSSYHIVPINFSVKV
jgi:hypothetical protein